MDVDANVVISHLTQKLAQQEVELAMLRAALDEALDRAEAAESRLAEEGPHA